MLQLQETECHCKLKNKTIWYLQKISQYKNIENLNKRREKYILCRYLSRKLI